MLASHLFQWISLGAGWGPTNYEAVRHCRPERQSAIERGDLEAAEQSKGVYLATTERFFKAPVPGADPEEKVDERKERRLASFSWLLETQNQFILSGLTQGWKYFLVPAVLVGLDIWALPMVMPCPDQGGSTVCPINYLLSENVHIDPFWCMSHAAHNDLKVGLKHAGLWTHMLLMLMAWKAWKGPFDSHDHWGSVWNTIKANFDTLSRDEDIWFQTCSLGMLNDVGEAHRVHEAGIGDSLRRRLQADFTLTHLPGDASTTRFCDFIQRSRFEDAHWHCRLYGAGVTCHELKILDGSRHKAIHAAAEAAKAKLHAASSSGSKPSMKAQVEAEVRALRKSSVNALHLSYVMLSDEANQSRQRAIVLLAMPIVKFHQRANMASRDFDSAQAWMIDMCAGGVNDHLIAMVTEFNNVSNLEHIGFSKPAGPITVSQDTDEHLEILAQNPLAENMGSFFLHLFGLRVKRCLGLMAGWPTRRVLFGSQDPAVRKGAIAEFRSAWERYTRHLVEVDNPTCRYLRGKSTFNWAANKVIHAQLVAEDFEDTPRLQAQGIAAARRFITSQVAEDGFHILKGACDHRGNRGMGDVTCMHTMITTPELAQRHRFNWLDLTTAAPMRAAVLPPDCFVAKENRQHWDKLRGVKGYSDRVDWHSPGGHDFWDSTMVDKLLEWADTTRNTDHLDKLWKVCWLQSDR